MAYFITTVPVETPSGYNMDLTVEYPVTRDDTDGLAPCWLVDREEAIVLEGSGHDLNGNPVDWPRLPLTIIDDIVQMLWMTSVDTIGQDIIS